jgi:hypothetical protein
LADVGDMGEIPEAQMVTTWYPHGVLEVPPPLFVPVTPTDAGSSPVEGEVHTDRPALVQIHSGTQGATIEYRVDEDPHWRVYAGPIRLRGDSVVTIHARADRIGYSPSVEVSARFVPSPHPEPQPDPGR